jgi:EAL domain-containing protein (putative c-di-GMP-specific phosphodiesterase class I)
VKVVAKGVETEEQFNVLRSLRDQGPASADIFEGQGYLFSRPVAADAFEKLIREQHGQ